MLREKPTMQMVADTVGVSVSTVSRVLNSEDFATKETRHRIFEAAATLGYTPSRAKHASRPDKAEHEDGTLSTILLMAPDPLLDGLDAPDWIFRDVIPTLQLAAKKHGFRLILSSYAQDEEWGDATADRQVCGVLWMAHAREDLLARIAKTLPVVVINDGSLWPPHTSVLCNNRMVLFKAVEHLRDLGHDRIAYFDADESPKRPNVHCRERLLAYHEAVDYFGLAKDASLCLRERFGVNEHPAAVAKAMDKIFAMASPPTALIAPLRYSIQFLNESRKRGVAVPDGMSLVGIDNAPAAEWVDPPLTVVDCVYNRCAEAAIELLVEEKANPQRKARTLLLEPELIIRASTKMPVRTAT